MKRQYRGFFTPGHSKKGQCKVFRSDGSPYASFLSDSVLTKIDLNAANLPGIIFKNVEMLQANLHSAVMSNADLINAQVEYADLTCAK